MGTIESVPQERRRRRLHVGIRNGPIAYDSVLSCLPATVTAHTVKIRIDAWAARHFCL